MTLYKVLHYPHVLLRKKATSVEKFTDELRDFLKHFINTMYEFDGGGLAAPQIGVSKRIFVVDFKPAFESDKFDFKKESFRVFDSDNKEIEPKFPMVFINPTLVEMSEPIKVNWEGCLSFPNAESYNTDRFLNVEIHAQNEFGEKFSVKSSHLYASVCFQHEYDHLDGIMLVDRWNKNSFSDADVIADIKDFENDPAERKRMKKLKVTEASKLKFDFL
ncbi:peptide deformylase [Pigmentibacter sp. JX0631]|uniref:peptide deformylase n=1 Tax=Pigmentibacter sp. JX0631 TaxID=2976982 RepID=UPI002468552C|nr:peptide deformylase [Pigmentibacter sp. JX0631]WGL58566.1 peptide deformylase [Pigmentibacter sp. JX0631]